MKKVAKVDLDNHTIKGSKGINSSNENADKAIEGDALQVKLKEFDLVITGSGKVIGGNGAAVTRASKRSGADGSDGIHLLGTGSNYTAGRLEYGISIDGGAEIYGGKGGAGIGQDHIFTSYTYDNALRRDMPNFTVPLPKAKLSMAKLKVEMA